MKKTLIRITGMGVLALLLSLAAGLPSFAQGGNTSRDTILPPAIVSFTADARSITVEAMEAGTAQVALAWATAGLTNDYRMNLFALQAGDWTLLTNDELPSAGGARLTIGTSSDFSPPTYRMAIFNRQNQLISQAIITLPFDTTPPANPPAVTVFQTINPTIDFVDLAQNRARVGVRWQVQSRIPSANIVFEQILPDGQVLPVELPRLVRWIPSRGEGVVAPVLPNNDAVSITLRLRLIDYAQGQAVLAESTIAVPINRGGQTSLATVTPVLTPPAPVVISTTRP